MNILIPLCYQSLHDPITSQMPPPLPSASMGAKPLIYELLDDIEDSNCK